MKKITGFTIIELLIVICTIGIVSAVFLDNIMLTPDHVARITPAQVTSRYNSNFDEDVGVVATVSQGDFIILRNVSLEVYLSKYIGGYCEVNYDYMGFKRYKVIVTAHCE